MWPTELTGKDGGLAGMEITSGWSDRMWPTGIYVDNNFSVILMVEIMWPPRKMTIPWLTSDGLTFDVETKWPTELTEKDGELAGMEITRVRFRVSGWNDRMWPTGIYVDNNFYLGGFVIIWILYFRFGWWVCLFCGGVRQQTEKIRTCYIQTFFPCESQVFYTNQGTRA
jgi:hypothetical protein